MVAHGFPFIRAMRKNGTRTDIKCRNAWSHDSIIGATALQAVPQSLQGNHGPQGRGYSSLQVINFDCADGKGYVLLAYDPSRLHRHRVFPGHAHEVDLPRRRPTRRPMEQTGERDGGWIGGLQSPITKDVEALVPSA